MKHFYLTLLALSTVFLTACPQNTKSNGSTEYDYEKIPGRDMHDGGADTGGGAGIKGRMLESHRVKMTDNEFFTEQILPIIEAIGRKDVGFAADLMHIATQRQWYFLPVDLAKIPAHEMVTTVRGDNVSQIAIQNESEIWFDQRIYGPLNDSERKDAILHELVMGVRLMEFQKAFDHCLAAAADFLILKNDEQYATEKRKCSGKKLAEFQADHSINRSPKRLTPEDYNVVRRITIALRDVDGHSDVELRAMSLIDLRRGSHRR